MREKKCWKKRRPHAPLTPEKLMHILEETEGGERAKEAYRNLTGKEPPEIEVNLKSIEAGGVSE